jgi:hypothetical protein
VRCTGVIPTNVDTGIGLMWIASKASPTASPDADQNCAEDPPGDSNWQATWCVGLICDQSVLDYSVTFETQFILLQRHLNGTVSPYCTVISAPGAI